MKIINVVGARPNFMKIAPLMDEMQQYPDLEPILIHTGQHYDVQMSKLFFQELGIPKPDINLEVGSGSHAAQTSMIMQRFEDVLHKYRPDMVIVVGDVNSTLACALTSVKLGIPVAHVEAGLRSFDRTMPEEINRLLTDAISDYLFTTEESANANLFREGISPKKIYFVGNVMIDTLMQHRERAARSTILSRMGIEQPYGLVTLHRPSNVDCRDTLESILSALHEVARDIPLIFPCHPRTRERIAAFHLSHYVSRREQGRVLGGMHLYDPLGYLDFLKLLTEARVVLTDSGGIQEETSILGVPCLTLRDNTERPVTVTEGTNVIVGMARKHIVAKTQEVLRGHSVTDRIPRLWDGKAAKRIVQIIRTQAQPAALSHPNLPPHHTAKPHPGFVALP